jgi:hypothetical protein
VNKKPNLGIKLTERIPDSNYPTEIFFFQGKIRYLNGCCNTKTGNVFVTESLPKYTIFCYFTACSGEKISEVITDESVDYAVLSVLAFSVHSLVTELCLKRLLSYLYPSLYTCFD